MQDVLDKARALGEALARHPRVTAFHEAQREVQNDSEAQALLQEYQTHARRMRQLEAEGKPVEVADKHKLKDLEGRMAVNMPLQRMLRIQADYLELMERVNAAMEAPLASDRQPQPSH